MGVYGGGMLAPMAHLWFKTLDAKIKLPRFQGGSWQAWLLGVTESEMAAVAVKVLLDAAIPSPFFITTFLIFSTVVVKKQVDQTLRTSPKASLVVSLAGCSGCLASRPRTICAHVARLGQAMVRSACSWVFSTLCARVKQAVSSGCQLLVCAAQQACAFS